MRRGRDTGTLDLLAWAPPSPAVAPPAEKVRAESLQGRVCRSIALALRECGKERDQVAADMGLFLGEPVSKAMLDAYASQAREDHSISVHRFAALVHATGDHRLLGLVPELFGYIVVPRKYAHWIRAAIARDKAEEMQRLAEAELRLAKQGSMP